jgi:hypothetical protein
LAVSSEPPVRWHTREDSGLSIDRDLQWWHDGARIEHPRIIEAFNRGLSVTAEGRYQLTFGHDWCFVTVAGCAFGAVTVDLHDAQVWLRLSDRTAEPLDPMSLAMEPDGALSAAVKQGRARAKLTRPAHLELAGLLALHEGAVVLEHSGTRWPTSLSPAALG